MKTKARVILICALLLTAGCLPAFAEQLSISGLKITGTNKVSKREILKVITTNAPSFFYFLPGVRLPEFDRSVLNDDMERILNLYQSYGYYHARAQYSLAINEKKKRVRITIIISEGNPTLVNDVSVKIVSAEEASVRPAVEAAVLLHKGDVFRIEFYDKTKERIDRFLENNGYAAPDISGKATVDQNRYRASIVFDIVTGPLQFFGPVNIEGNTIVNDRDILREVTFLEGMKFSRQAISDSQRNIFRLNLFSSVVLTPDTDRGKIVPVSIRVDEKELRTLSMGFGYGNEDRIRAQISWSRRYLGGMPRTLYLNARYSSILYSGALDLNQHYFIDRFSSLGIHTGYDRTNYVSYSNERINTLAQARRSFNDTVEGFFAYSLEVNRPVSVSRTTIIELTDTRPGDYFFISGLLFGVRYDTVQGNLNPLYGSVFSLSAEPATYLLGSKVDYLRLIGEGRLFYPVAGENVLATRLRIGAIEPLRNTTIIPIFKRFFSGGSSSVRGYAFQSLGPTDESGNPIGGEYLVEGNLEVRYPVYGGFSGVVFMDAGNVFSDRFAFSLSDLRYAAGIGARYSTVVGPVRVDLAFPLEPFPELNWGRYSIYLSLGNAF